MRKLSAIALVVMLTATVPAMAYTPEDVEACTPDAVRLCQQAIPNETRVAICLVRNRQQLNRACTLVVNRELAESASNGLSARFQKTRF